MTTPAKRPQKSVWDRLAELPPEGRENYLFPAKSGVIRGKKTKKTVGGVIYSQTDYQIPDIVQISPEADE